jgi:magnesium transporter
VGLHPTHRKTLISTALDRETADVDVLRPSGEGVERHAPAELDMLLDSGGVVWVDVPGRDDDAAAVLTERFGIHQRAAADCARRNPVPGVHVYPGHVFVVRHAPERGDPGHCTTSSSTGSSVPTG